MISLKMFDAALQAIEESKGIARDVSLEILRQAFIKAYKVIDEPDILAECEFNLKTGEIRLYYIKHVVAEVTDDLFEIELDDAKEIKADIEVGQDLEFPVDINKLMSNHKFINSVSSNLNAGIKDKAKEVLLEKFKGKIGELIVGEVEKIDNNVILSFGQTTAVLNAKNRIPGEEFKIGEQVRVYLSGADQREGMTNMQLLITRTDENFLKKIFEEEIHDIYSGTVVIKGVAREAGERSKVAVVSLNPDVDPTGACIGTNGSRINRIRAALHDEKIEIMKYSDNKALYIIEALKPATVVGVNYDIVKNEAVAVVLNENSKVAIGKKGINVRLASKLTGVKIDIKEIDEAMNLGIRYRLVEDIMKDEENRLVIRAQEHKVVRPLVTDSSEINTILNLDNNVDEKIIADDNLDDVEDNEELDNTAELTVNDSELKDNSVIEPTAQVAEEHVEITTTKKVDIKRLEKEIEDEKNARRTAQTQSSNPYGYKKKEDKKEEKPTTSQTSTPVAPVMPIYTEEELAELERAEAEENEGTEEKNYDEYDNDEFYVG